MAKKYIHTDWRTFSRKFVAYQGLPYGSELKLFHAGGRKARSDMEVSRLRVNASTTRRLDDDDRVSALRNAALKLVAADFTARKLDLQLCGPDGSLVAGNTLIRSVRRLPPALTAFQTEQKVEEAAQLVQLQDIAIGSLEELEHLVENPEEVVCKVFVDALVSRFGRRAVQRALGR